MYDEKLLQEVTAKAQTWLSDSYDEQTRAEVQAMLDNEDKTELVESFYKTLEFGTGGLRGIMGAGCNRMNIYTVGSATQGLANYLNEAFKDLDQISVVVGHDRYILIDLDNGGKRITAQEAAKGLKPFVQKK